MAEEAPSGEPGLRERDIITLLGLGDEDRRRETPGDISNMRITIDGVDFDSHNVVAKIRAASDETLARILGCSISVMAPHTQRAGHRELRSISQIMIGSISQETWDRLRQMPIWGAGPSMGTLRIAPFRLEI